MNSFTGWGEGSNSKHLYQTHLEWMSPDVCKKDISPGFLPEDMICAGHIEHDDNRGTCHVGILAINRVLKLI